MSARNWTDQPEELDNVPIVLRFYDEVMIEVRKDQVDWTFVTAGNLFGSQTVKCPDLEQALQVVQGIVDKKFKEERELPLFCVLMKNSPST